jgi:galactose oxidase
MWKLASGALIFLLLMVVSGSSFAASPSGTTIPPATQIIDSTSGTWTVDGSGVCYLNGVQAGGCAHVTTLLFYQGAIYANTTAYGWWQWVGNQFQQVAGDPRRPGVVGSWSKVIPLANNPVAAVLLRTGKVLTWSSNTQTTFEGEIGTTPSQTYVGLFDPNFQTSTTTLVTAGLADMFCPGIAIMPDGTVVVNGGSSSPRTTIYSPSSNSWTVANYMNIPRGYNSDVLLQDGTVLTIGGSWSGALGDKIGEVWSASTWQTRSGISAVPIAGPDPEDQSLGYIYRGDNHAWLFALSNQRILHAGPSAEMHWITTSGQGSIVSAGFRNDDPYSMNGNAVLYDVGKVFKTGGAPGYQDAFATTNTYLIDASKPGQNPTVSTLAPMNYARAFSNSVVLPTGQVLVVGGQTYASPFSDDGAVLVPELWDPVSQQFSLMAQMQTPRTYHSTALLLPDGRVFVGGGGLCGTCNTNHMTVEIFSPPYLFNSDGTAATRPSITLAPSSANRGTNITVATSASNLTFALVRMGAVTHTVDNDQRRVPLLINSSSRNSYSLPIPSDAGIVVPGYYMLFAINPNGTPSVGTIIKII